MPFLAEALRQIGRGLAIVLDQQDFAAHRLLDILLAPSFASAAKGPRDAARGESGSQRRAEAGLAYFLAVAATFLAGAAFLALTLAFIGFLAFALT